MEVWCSSQTIRPDVTESGTVLTAVSWQKSNPERGTVLTVITW